MSKDIENHSLVRKISIVLILKLLLLYTLWKVCFSHPLPSAERKERIQSIFLLEGLDDK